MLWPTRLQVRATRGGPELVLRGLRMSDRREWERLRELNQDWLKPWEATSPVPAQVLSFRRMVRHLDRAAATGVMQPFVLEVGGRLAGQTHLSQITWGSSRSAHVGYWIDRRMAGRGLTTTAVAAAVDHAFYGLGLHRVVAQIHEDNAASLRVVEKLGFVDEGVARRALYVDGEWRDHRVFSLVAEDLQGASLVARRCAAHTVVR